MKRKIPQKIEVYYLGKPNYNENGTSWRGLGADSRNTFYVPALDIVLLRNSDGEYCYFTNKSQLGKKIKTQYKTKLAEMLSIRPMTENEKKPHQKHYDEQTREYEDEKKETQEKIQKLKDSIKNRGFRWENSLIDIQNKECRLKEIIKNLESIQKHKINLETATVYYNIKNKVWIPTSRMDEFEKIEMNHELILNFMNIYDKYLKIREAIEKMDCRLKGLDKIVEGESHRLFSGEFKKTF